MLSRGLLWRAAIVLPTVTSTLTATPLATPTLAVAPACQFSSPAGGPNPITHVIHLQFDNVHFTRDNPNVPSDLEQMPHLLSFIENNGTLLANEHTPLIAHTANDFVTALTGVYGDQHGIPVSNSFEYYDNSPTGSFNTSAFTYWTDRVAGKATNPFEMVDSAGNNLQAPWVPFVNAGCNFGAVSTANMVLENATTEVDQVFGGNPPPSTDRFNDFVGIAVHCADTTCSSVGAGPGANPMFRPEPGGQGKAALFGHKSAATQVTNINCLGDCQPARPNVTAINGFNQANGFNPTAAYTLGYLVALLQANVPVVYGEIADAHDSGKSCSATTATSPTVSPATTPQSAADPKVCGAFAPGEPGYVAKLKSFDDAFAQFFQRLDTMGLNASNTLFVVHSDENDHYASSAPLNPGCDGVTTPCTYDRTRLGEITTDLPLLLRQQNLSDFGAGRGAPTFANTDLPYGIDFDTAPGFWLKGHPAHGSAAVRKLEGALARVTSPNPYTGNQTEQLFRFLVDEPGLQALHMVTSDPNRTPGVIGFGAEDHFIQTLALIGSSGRSSCNTFPTSVDQAVCLNPGFIWLHGNFEPDVNNTWAAIAGPGVAHKGIDERTFVDHTDLRPTITTLLCLNDTYRYEGRAVLEDLEDAALTPSAREERSRLTELGRVLKQINAPVGIFGQAAIQVSTTAIRSDDRVYTALSNALQAVVAQRDRVAGQIEAQLTASLACSSARPAAATSSASQVGRDRAEHADGGTVNSLRDQAADVLETIKMLGRSRRES